MKSIDCADFFAPLSSFSIRGVEKFYTMWHIRARKDENFSVGDCTLPAGVWARFTDSLTMIIGRRKFDRKVILRSLVRI